jgi:hypothetical protein
MEQDRRKATIKMYQAGLRYLDMEYLCKMHVLLHCGGEHGASAQHEHESMFVGDDFE